MSEIEQQYEQFKKDVSNVEVVTEEQVLYAGVVSTLELIAKSNTNESTTIALLTITKSLFDIKERIG